MPFRAVFSCLWCGRPWTAAGPEALEGWAQLCPDCLGRAGDNGFLRARLRAAIAERGRASSVTAAPTVLVPPTGVLPRPRADVVADEAAPAPEDDWYRRRGRHDHGPLDDLAWSIELDEATLWLDGRPLAGRIVELAAGSGWWSPLLAAKGELWCYDASGESLDRARERLLAHRLRAHLHVRDPWAAPEPPPADALFLGFWLGRIPWPRLADFLGLARRWLESGGQLAAIDSRPDPAGGAVDPALYDPDELRSGLLAAGFTEVEIRTTSRFFVLISARAV